MITLIGFVALMTGGAWFIAGLVGGELFDDARADMRRRARAQAQARANSEFWMNERARIAARSKVIF